MEIVILGSGTSTGLPVLGCKCPVCNSAEPKDRRMRVSVAVKSRGKTILIDTSPDLREQALREKLFHVDAILFTHAHADHANGIDDTRLFNLNNGFKPIPAFASPETAEALVGRFGYAFGLSHYPGAPKLTMTPVQGSFEAAGLAVEAIEVPHGPAGMTLAFRIGNFAYITDCNDVPEGARARLQGLDALVLDALRKEPHPTHLHFARAIELVGLIGPKRTYFTHLSHDIGHVRDGADLPEGVELAYDGLQIQIP